MQISSTMLGQRGFVESPTVLEREHRAFSRYGLLVTTIPETQSCNDIFNSYSTQFHSQHKLPLPAGTISRSATCSVGVIIVHTITSNQPLTRERRTSTLFLSCRWQLPDRKNTTTSVVAGQTLDVSWYAAVAIVDILYFSHSCRLNVWPFPLPARIRECFETIYRRKAIQT
jgi:hypothetical protein